MKKAKKILLTILPVMMLVLVVFVSFGSNVLATDSNNVPSTFPTGGTVNFGDTEVGKAAGNIWSIVLSVVQILAFAAIIFAGVRYMFASADQKADIKKGLIYLVLGAVLVFASATIVRIIINTTGSIAPETSNSIEMVQEIEKV